MKNAKLIVPLILLLALSLRLYGLNFGLPHIYAGPDEMLHILRALKCGTGDFHPQIFVHGSLYIYLLFAVYGLFFVIGFLAGNFGGVSDFGHLFLMDPSIFFIIARLCTVFFGVATVYFVYKVGREMFGRREGILSALFLAVAFLHVRDSHLAQLDVPTAFFMVPAFLYILRIARTGERKFYLAAGFFLGLATATKLIAISLIPSLICAHFLFNRRRHANLLGGLLVVVLIYLIVTPFAILDFSAFINDIKGRIIYVNPAGSANEWYDVKFAGSVLYLFGVSLRYGVGVLATIFFIISIIYALKGFKEPSNALLLSFVLPYICIIGLEPYTFVRYAVPLLPFFVLMIPKLFSKEYLFGKSRILAASFFILLLLEPFYSSLAFDNLISKKDTRAMSKEWIEKNISAGSSILILGAEGIGVLGGFGAPILNKERKQLQQGLEGLSGYRRNWMNLALGFEDYPPPPRYYVYRDREYAYNAYGVYIDREFTYKDSNGLSRLDFHMIKERGIKYVVTSEHFLVYSNVPEVVKEDLLANFKKIKEFNPLSGIKQRPVYDWGDAFYVPLNRFSEVERPGPIIRIYEEK